MAWRIMHNASYDTKYEGKSKWCLPSKSEQAKADKQPALSFSSFVDLTSNAGLSFEHYLQNLRDAPLSDEPGIPNDTAARDDTYYAKTLASCAAAFDTVRVKVRGRDSPPSGPADSRKHLDATAEDPEDGDKMA